MFKSGLSKLNRTVAKYYPSHVPPSIIRYMVPLCIFGRTTSSICFWNSTTVIMVDDFEQNFITVGATFASAAAFDFMISLYILSQSWGEKGEKKSNPILSVYHVMICMAGLTLSSMVIAIPNLYAFIAGFVVFAVFNSMLKIAIFDLQGSNNNATESITIQMIRRFLTAVALYSIPLLYKVHPRLPLVLALWFALLSSLVLAFLLTCCHVSEEVQKLDDDVEKRKTNLEKSRSRRRQSSRPERNLLYSERVMLGRLLSGKDV